MTTDLSVKGALQQQWRQGMEGPGLTPAADMMTKWSEQALEKFYENLETIGREIAGLSVPRFSARESVEEARKKEDSRDVVMHSWLDRMSESYREAHSDAKESYKVYQKESAELHRAYDIKIREAKEEWEKSSRIYEEEMDKRAIKLDDGRRVVPDGQGEYFDEVDNKLVGDDKVEAEEKHANISDVLTKDQRDLFIKERDHNKRALDYWENKSRELDELDIKRADFDSDLNSDKQIYTEEQLIQKKAEFDQKLLEHKNNLSSDIASNDMSDMFTPDDIIPAANDRGSYSKADGQGVSGLDLKLAFAENSTNAPSRAPVQPVETPKPQAFTV